MSRAAAVAAALLLAGACVDIELRRIGPDRPSRPPGCAVDLFPGEKGPLNYGAHTEVAVANVSCRNRERCIEEIKKQACAVGARGVYWPVESTEGGYTQIDARFVVPAARPSDRELWGPGGDLR